MRRILLVACLLLCVPAAAQEEGLDGPSGEREVTEEMARACPELRTAAGRRKAQLLALHFDLEGKHPQDDDAKKIVADAFDLSNAEDTAFLEKLLTERGAFRVQHGIRIVLAASGAKGLAWALERFETIKPEGKGRLIDCMAFVGHREAWRFLEKLLDDRTPVPNWRASQEAPPGYVDLRVCDHALRTLGSRLLAAGVKLPGDVKTQVGSMMSIEERQTRIAKTKSALLASKSYSELVTKSPSVLEGLEGDAKKATAERLKKLGVE